MEDNDLLTIKEVCEILKITRLTLYKLTKKGDITAYKLGRAVRYRRGDIMAGLKRMYQPIGVENLK